MRVLVAVDGEQGHDVVALDLPEGATLAQALAAARVAERHPGLSIERVGVWGKRRDPSWKLREGDRAEVYRPLKADAKAMRRARAGLRPSTRSRNGP